MFGKLEDKVAIITGAGRASGIGRAAAIELARGGADVVVTDLARSRPETDMLGHSTVASDTTGLEEAVAEIEAAAARVHGVMAPTPQIRWPLLCQRTGCEVWVKHENHTPIGAFKVRGGMIHVGELRRAEPNVTGVIAAPGAITARASPSLRGARGSRR